MRGGLSPRGYTIVEVMIFLAISGVMFLMAASFVSGKQAKSEFRQGMNEINTQIQQVINDVSNGFYPTNNNFSCKSGATGNPVLGPVGFAASGVQGTNQGCVFLGKIMQFQAADSSGTLDPAAYNVYAVAGRQYAPNSISNIPSDFNEAHPIVVTSPVDITDKKVLQWGTQVTGMYDGPVNSSDQIGAIGFFGSFGQQPGGQVQSGSQTTVAMAIPNISPGQMESVVVTKVAASSEGMALDGLLASEPNPDITICFDGGASQFGSITIGGASGQRLTTSLQIGESANQVGC